MSLHVAIGIIQAGKVMYTRVGELRSNIGVHFYDMLSWVFGPVKKNIVHVYTHDRAAGYLELERARVRYFLSINSDNLPENAVSRGEAYLSYNQY